MTTDVEATTFQKGNPYSTRNKLCLVGLNIDKQYEGLFIEYDGKPYGKQLARINGAIRESSILVGFNLKYEFGWFRRYGIGLPKGLAYWDCQLADYIISRQKHKMPSLNECASRAGLGQKIDKIGEYWDQGIDTRNIPRLELLEYNEQDCSLTEQLFQLQWESPFQRLILESSYDLLITSEMEYNGLFWHQTVAERKAMALDKAMDGLAQALDRLVPTCPINWSSPEQLSVVLYGGTIHEKYKEDYEFFYKKGGSKYKQRTAIREHVFEGLVTPDPKSKLAKEGQYATDEKTLQRLKAKGLAAKIIDLVLRRKGLEKLKGTYYDGFTSRIRDYSWDHSLVHTSFGHTSTDTGRLSSSKPNIQNVPEEVRECVITRYPSR